MKKKYSIGIIGAGMYGKVHIRSLKQDNRAEIAWVCSASRETTDAAAVEFNIPKRTLDYKDILSDPAVDAVIIATPPYLHCQQLVDALGAGKHVLLEKPMAISPEGVSRIVDAAGKSKECIVLEASCRHTRLQPKYEFIKKIVKSGKLGRIYHIHHNALSRGTFIEWNKNGAWGMDKKLAGGGPFIDWGAYDLSFHLGLLDDVPELKTVKSFSIGGLRDLSHLVGLCDTEQHGAAWMEFDGDLTYYYERGAGVHCETNCETRLYGTKGGLRFFYPGWESCEVEYFFDDGESRKEKLVIDMSGAVDDNVALTRHFLDCIDGKADPEMPVSIAAKHMRILFKILNR